MKQKNKKSGFFTMLLGALSASLLGNLLTDKGVMRAGEGGAVMSQGQGTIRAGQDFKWDNNTYHAIIKIKTVDETYIDFNKDDNKEGPKFKIGNHIRMSKYKNIFAKGYVPNLSEKVIKRKGNKPYVKWKGYDSFLTVGLIKKT